MEMLGCKKQDSKNSEGTSQYKLQEEKINVSKRAKQWTCRLPTDGLDYFFCDKNTMQVAGRKEFLKDNWPSSKINDFTFFEEKNWVENLEILDYAIILVDASIFYLRVLGEINVWAMINFCGLLVRQYPEIYIGQRVD